MARSCREEEEALTFGVQSSGRCPQSEHGVALLLQMEMRRALWTRLPAGLSQPSKKHSSEPALSAQSKSRREPSFAGSQRLASNREKWHQTSQPHPPSTALTSPGAFPCGAALCHCRFAQLSSVTWGRCRCLPALGHRQRTEPPHVPRSSTTLCSAANLPSQPPPADPQPPRPPQRPSPLLQSWSDAEAVTAISLRISNPSALQAHADRHGSS